MSCIRNYSSKVFDDIDKDVLKKACESCGYIVDEDKKRISNGYSSVDVDAVLVKIGNTDNTKDQVGFVFTEDVNGKIKLEVKMDTYELRMDEHQFIDPLAQAYRQFDFLKNAEAQGYSYQRSEVTEDGYLEVYVEAWA